MPLNSRNSILSYFVNIVVYFEYTIPQVVQRFDVKIKNSQRDK